MAGTVEIFFIVIFALEAVTIIIGNTFTIFVFWSKRSHLKRTCFLLINLALADLLVGLTEAIVRGTTKIPRMTVHGPSGPAGQAGPAGLAGPAGQARDSNRNASSAFQILFSSTSVTSLALMSLERAFSVLRPLYHRAMDTRVYIYSIVMVWVVGFIIAGLSLLGTYHEEVDRRNVMVSIHWFLFICVVVICASFLKIRTRMRHTKPVAELGNHNKNSVEQSLRLSRTCLIVVVVSLGFWLPAFVLYTIRDFCHCLSPPLVSFGKVLHLANSIANPFVYAFRMPILKDALKKCWRKRQQSIELINRNSRGNATATTEP